MSSPNKDLRSITIGDKIFTRDYDGDYLCVSRTAGVATPYSTFKTDLDNSSWNDAVKKARRENKYVALTRAASFHDWVEVAMASDLTTVLVFARLRDWRPIK